MEAAGAIQGQVGAQRKGAMNAAELEERRYCGLRKIYTIKSKASISEKE